MEKQFSQLKAISVSSLKLKKKIIQNASQIYDSLRGKMPPNTEIARSWLALHIAFLRNKGEPIQRLEEAEFIRKSTLNKKMYQKLFQLFCKDKQDTLDSKCINEAAKVRPERKKRIREEKKEAETKELKKIKENIRENSPLPKTRTVVKKIALKREDGINYMVFIYI